ncbi:MAG: trigger factor [Lachnospiraceae bacterium]|nr:trigger factor [Lachnospiraceae bacterium]
MSVKVETLENNMAKLTVEVSAAELDKALDKAYNRQKNSISMPGFRKGKAPRAMVEKMYGAEIFYEDAANILLQETYPDAYDESGLDIVSQPTIDVIQLERGKDFIYTAEVALKPEVKLGKYKGVSITKADTKVTAAEVKAETDKEREASARTVKVEKALKNGDTAVIDFVGSIDGEEFDGGVGEDYPLELGSHSFIEGFEEQLVGKKVGDDVDVNVTFPTEYQAKELAGKDALFKVTIKDATRKELPKLDEAFADDKGFDSVDDYKADVKKKLQERKAEEGRRLQEDEAMEKVIEAAEMDIPEAMIDNQVNTMLSDMSNQLMQSGLSMEQYMQFTGMTMDKFKEQVRPDAVKRIQGSLVLEAIVAAEKIEATDADVDAEIEKMAKAYGMEAEQLMKTVQASDRENIKADLASQKALEFIMDNAKETAKKSTTKKAADKDAEEKPAKKTTAKKTTTKKAADKDAEEKPAKKTTAKKTTTKKTTTKKTTKKEEE